MREILNFGQGTRKGETTGWIRHRREDIINMHLQYGLGMWTDWTGSRYCPMAGSFENVIDSSDSVKKGESLD
jgi:hypothetical protein